MIIKVNLEKYPAVRSTINSGDIVAYSSKSWVGTLVRMVTGQTYSHVGIIIREYDRVMVIESVEGKGVIKRPLSDNEEFYLIRHSIPFEQAEIMRAHAELGKSYSYLDALLAGLGFKTLNDDKWQCAEFVGYVFNLYLKVKTPGLLVEYVLSEYPCKYETS
jgi:hypothetical protein